MSSSTVSTVTTPTLTNVLFNNEGGSLTAYSTLVNPAALVYEENSITKYVYDQQYQYGYTFDRQNMRYLDYLLPNSISFFSFSSGNEPPTALNLIAKTWQYRSFTDPDPPNDTMYDSISSSYSDFFAQQGSYTNQTSLSIPLVTSVFLTNLGQVNPLDPPNRNDTASVQIQSNPYSIYNDNGTFKYVTNTQFYYYYKFGTDPLYSTTNGFVNSTSISFYYPNSRYVGQGTNSLMSTAKVRQLRSWTDGSDTLLSDYGNLGGVVACPFKGFNSYIVSTTGIYNININNGYFYSSTASPYSLINVNPTSFSFQVYENSISTKGNLLSSTVFEWNTGIYPTFPCTITPYNYYTIEAAAINYTGTTTTSFPGTSLSTASASFRYVSLPTQITNVSFSSFDTPNSVVTFDGGFGGTKSIQIFSGTRTNLATNSVATYNNISSGDTLSFTALPGYSYAARVSSANASGTVSANSVNTVTKAPAAPPNVCISAISANSITCRWDPVVQNSYSVNLYTSPTYPVTFASTYLGSFNISGPNQNIGNVQINNNFYAYNVVAYNEAGSTPSLLSPTVPYGLSIVPYTNLTITTVTSDGLQLVWEGGQNVSLNNVYIYASTATNYNNLALIKYFVNQSSSDFLSFSTSRGLYYTAQIYAENLVGQTLFSTYSSFFTYTPPNPQPPIVVGANYQNQNNILVNGVLPFANPSLKVLVYEKNSPTQVINDSTRYFGLNSITSFPAAIPTVAYPGSPYISPETARPIPGLYYSAIAYANSTEGEVNSFDGDYNTWQTYRYAVPPTLLDNLRLHSLTTRNMYISYQGVFGATSVTARLYYDGTSPVVTTFSEVIGNYNAPPLGSLTYYNTTAITFSSLIPSVGSYAFSIIPSNQFGSYTSRVSNVISLN